MRNKHSREKVRRRWAMEMDDVTGIWMDGGMDGWRDGWMIEEQITIYIYI